MASRTPRTLAACFAAFAIAVSGVVTGGASHAHAASATVSPSNGSVVCKAGLYINNI